MGVSLMFFHSLSKLKLANLVCLIRDTNVGLEISQKPTIDTATTYISVCKRHQWPCTGSLIIVYY